MQQMKVTYPTRWQNFQQPNTSRKWLYITGGTIVSAGLVYLAWRAWKKSKSTGADSDLAKLLSNSGESGFTNKGNSNTGNANSSNSNLKSEPSALLPVTTPSLTPDDFPLKVGSRNKFVGQLQYALNNLYGAGLTTDSIFGSKTKAALDQKQIKLPLEQNAYYEIVDKYLARAGNDLYNFGLAGDYTKCKNLLSTFVIPYDYTTASDVFKASYFIGGTRMTLVTGMLKKFTTATQQREIEAEFKRMGLVKDSEDKWRVPTLSGLEKFNVLTIANTAVTLPDNTLIPIEKAVMLGRMTAMDASYVYLENNGQQMKVPWESVKVLS
jgi:hypothetical protein